MMLFAEKTRAQDTITGKVKDAYNAGIANVRVFIEGSYDETISNTDGTYQLITTETGPRKIIAHLEGYEDLVKDIVLATPAKNFTIDFVFSGKVRNMQTVIVLSDKTQLLNRNLEAKLLTPTEIITTATDGNFIAAFKLLPGAQQVGESGELFVRGGAGHETKLFVDGMLVNNFLRNAAPNQAATNRLPAGLFNGTHFNSGGYSALYGQALSSALVLETTDLPYRSNGNLSISPIFANGDFQLLSKNSKSSFGASLSYLNFNPYSKTFKSSIDNQQFNDPPVSLEGYLRYVGKTSKTGFIKLFSNYSNTTISFDKGSIDDPAVTTRFFSENTNLLNMLSWRESFGKTKVEGGITWSRNLDQIRLDSLKTTSVVNGQPLKQQLDILQSRIVFKRDLSKRINLQAGTEFQYFTDRYIQTANSLVLKDRLLAVFGELRYSFSPRLISVSGLRYEYSSLLGKGNIAPRLNLIYSPTKSDQFSFSYGIFYQKPLNQFLLNKNELSYEKAIHYIATYQLIWKERLMRVETYYKKYEQLIKTSPSLNNNGNGYATGGEIFWKDKKSITDFEYWISYSFVRTERFYLNYPIRAVPPFAASHTASLVIKRFFEKLSLMASTTYSYATGRTYFNPNQPASRFLSDRTIDYHNINLNLSYLTKIRRAFSVIVLTVSNLTNNKQVFSYQYSALNQSKREEVRSLYNRFIFLGLFINFGIDRRNQVINDQL
jgi:vitamin B12 transporter